MKTNESWACPSAASCVYRKNEYRGSVAEMQAAKPSALVELVPASAISSPGLILYLQSVPSTFSSLFFPESYQLYQIIV